MLAIQQNQQSISRTQITAPQNQVETKQSHIKQKHTTPEQMQFLVDTKSYRLVPNCVHIALHKDKRLTPADRSIWQDLYHRMNYEYWEVMNYPHRTADNLDLKLETVQRCQARLVECGWLDPLSHNNDRNNSVMVYEICIPDYFHKKYCVDAKERDMSGMSIKNKQRTHIEGKHGQSCSVYRNSNGKDVACFSENVGHKNIEQMIHFGINNSLPVTSTPAAESIPAAPHNAPLPAEIAETTTYDAPQPQSTPKIESFTKQSVVNDSDSSETVGSVEQAKAQQAEKIRVEAEIEVLDKKITSKETGIVPRMHLMADRRKLERVIEPVTTASSCSLSLNKLHFSKKTEGIIQTQAVNPSATKQTRLFSENAIKKPQKPWRCAGNTALSIPAKIEKMVDDVILERKHCTSNPVETKAEMMWAIKHQFRGKPKDKHNPSIAQILFYNACVAVKIARKGEWSAPYDYPPRLAKEGKLKALEQAKNKQRK
ncbi:hypothetical protein HRU45_00255, partial [Candidatus Dependentiae bacterium]|nr:hypothetical protein [Candidatus Dependentiae bacterium]